MYLGRAPCTKETLPDFRERCRVARHSQVFRGLTGSQRTPGDRGVTIWFMFLKIVIVFENLDNTISIFYEICFCSLNFAFTFFFLCF